MVCYVALLLLSGLLLGTKANFPFRDTYKNGTYVLSYIIGITSLLSIFSTTLMAAQLLFRERDARFEPVLYATPLRKSPYVLSRFAIIFGVSIAGYVLLIAGLFCGQLSLAGEDRELGPIRLLNYLNPFWVLLLPNIFFCTAVACSIGLWTRSKMMVYVSGVLIYFLYWGISFMTNSPLIANSNPVSPESMKLAAIADPLVWPVFLNRRITGALRKETTGFCSYRVTCSGTGCFILVCRWCCFIPLTAGSDLPCGLVPENLPPAVMR